MADTDMSYLKERPRIRNVEKRLGDDNMYMNTRRSAPPMAVMKAHSRRDLMARSGDNNICTNKRPSAPPLTVIPPLTVMKARSRRDLMERSRSVPALRVDPIRPENSSKTAPAVRIGPTRPKKERGFFSAIVDRLKEEVEGSIEEDEKEEEYLDESAIKNMVGGSDAEREVLNNIVFAKDQCFSVNKDGLITLNEEQSRPREGIFSRLHNSQTKKIERVASSPKLDNSADETPSSEFMSSFLSETVKAKITQRRQSAEKKVPEQPRNNNDALEDEVDVFWNK